MGEIMKKKLGIIISIIAAIALVICAYLFVPMRSYGSTHVTFRQYSALSNEQKLVDKITYGYAYFLDKETNNTLKSLPDSKLYDHTYFPESSIDALEKLKKQINSGKNNDMGSLLLGDIEDEMAGDGDIAYVSAGDESAANNFSDQIDTLASAAMVDLSQRGKMPNNKSKVVKIRKEFTLTTEKHINEVTY